MNNFERWKAGLTIGDLIVEGVSMFDKKSIAIICMICPAKLAGFKCSLERRCVDTFTEWANTPATEITNHEWLKTLNTDEFALAILEILQLGNGVDFAEDDQYFIDWLNEKRVE